MLTQQQVFNIDNEQQFTAAALQAFRHQARHCDVYRRFIEGLRVDVNSVDSIDKIPFLPISFFKSHRVLSSPDPVEVTFTSSGTTGMITSSHYVTDAGWYRE